MENATKALGMAAGVLIAIMVIALIYTLVSEISETQNQDELLLKAEQAAKFNQAYESYEKSLLRGTELITVINKAISNNVKYEDQDKIYDVNIRFTLRTPVTKVTVQVKNGETKKTKEETELEEDLTYELVDYDADDRINARLREFMKLGAKQNASDDGIYAEFIDERNYTKVYDNFKVFKRKLFKCTEIGYSPETSRVNLLVFEEVKQSDELEGYN